MQHQFCSNCLNVEATAMYDSKCNESAAHAFKCLFLLFDVYTDVFKCNLLRFDVYKTLSTVPFKRVDL